VTVNNPEVSMDTEEDLFLSPEVMFYWANRTFLNTSAVTPGLKFVGTNASYSRHMIAIKRAG